MSIIFKLTDAGREALVNAANNGTLARTVVSVGLTATAIAPGAPVAGEIKRLTTIAGDVVAGDTIHITIRDDGPDSYTVRGLGLYLDNGVLLGSYGQALPIIEKSGVSILLLATDLRMLDGSVDISTLLFGETDFLNPPATTERQGVVELANLVETAAGVDGSRAVTPAGLKPLLDDKQPLDAELSAVAALVSAANKLAYFTGAGTAALTDLSAFARTLLDDANAATALVTLGAAPLASPAFTGTPTAPTQTAGNNTTRLATTAFVQAAIATLINSAPGALDTLNELATALGNDPNFATTMANELASKQPLDATLSALAGLTVAANKLIYANGADAFATTDLSAFARTLLDDANAATARTTLGAASSDHSHLLQTEVGAVVFGYYDSGTSAGGDSYANHPFGKLVSGVKPASIWQTTDRVNLMLDVSTTLPGTWRFQSGMANSFGHTWYSISSNANQKVFGIFLRVA